MIALILGFIGYLTADGGFGAQIVSAVSLMEYWLWFTSIVVSIIAVVLVIVFIIGAGAIAQDSNLGTKGFIASMFGGGFLGMLIAVVLVALQWSLLWLSIWIQDNVNVDAVDWESLTQDSKVALIGMGVLLFISVLQSLRRTSSSKG